MALLTQFWSLDGLIIIFCAFIGGYCYFTRNFNYWKKRGVKEVSPTAFFGNFGSCIFSQKSLANVLLDIYKAGEDEPYIGHYVLDQPYLMIRDPELIKHVLIKDYNVFPDRNSQTHKSDPIGGMSILVIKSPTWKYIRQKLSPVFTTVRLRKMFELMLEIDNDFDVYLKSLNLEGQGREVKLKDHTDKFTTDLIGISAYGMRFNTLTTPNSLIQKAGKSIFGTTYLRYVELMSAWIMPLYVKIFGYYIFEKSASTYLKSVFMDAINARRKTGSKKADLIDLLIDLKNDQESNPPQDIQKLNDDALVAQTTVFFVGGFETSSANMSLTVYECAKNPEIQERLRKEILDALDKNNGKITYDMITSLPYLDMVVQETLRLYPLLHFLDRRTEVDYQLPGTKLTLKAGTPVIIPMYGIHTDPIYFPNPHIFDPERFSDENKEHIKSNTYFPFGDGPRICIGMRLGLLETKLGVVHLISKYEFSTCKDTPTSLELDPYNMFLAPRNGITLHMKEIRTKG